MVYHLGSSSALIVLTVSCRAGDSEADDLLSRQHGSGPPSRYPSRPSSPSPGGPTHLFRTNNWSEYPERFFPNWDSAVQDRCGMTILFQAIDAPRCRVYPIELGMDNRFHQGKTVQDHTMLVEPLRPTNEFAQFLDFQRDENVQLRCLCVESLSGSVLKMLGAHFRIEPFFFSSAINFIPSRYHEELPEQHGDHMYITLPFLRVTKERNSAGFKTPDVMTSGYEDAINISAALDLVGADKTLKVTLQQDMLAVLVVRSEGNHTLVTVHPGNIPHSARTLAHRLMTAERSVYWRKVISQAHDPVFMLLIVMWSTIYAWNEAVSAINTHATHLESQLLHMEFKQMEEASPQVHAIRAQLLWYEDLLHQLRKSIEFIANVGPMRWMDEKAQETANIVLKREIKTMLNEVDRLHRQQQMSDDRLNHVTKSVFSILNFKETQATLRHGESMKQITYLTTIYLPATFMATVFGMNIVEIVPGSKGNLTTYITIIIPLTVVTIWLVGFITVRVERPEFNFIRLVFWPTFIFLERAAVVWTSIRTVYFREREHAWSTRETLRAVDHPLPRPRVLPRRRSRDHSRPRTQFIDQHSVGNGRRSRANSWSRDHSRSRTQLSAAHPRGRIPSTGSRSNSAYLNQEHKPDMTTRWSESRPHSVASSRQSRHSIIGVERIARSRDVKPLEANYELQATTVPIVMHTPPGDPVVPTRSSLGRGYASGGTTGGERGGIETEAAAPNLLRPVFADQDFASGGRSDYVLSDVSTRPPTPGE